MPSVQKFGFECRSSASFSLSIRSIFVPIFFKLGIRVDMYLWIADG